MKLQLNPAHLTAILIASLITTSCINESSTIGGSIQPSGDSIHLYKDTIEVSSKTIRMEDVFYNSDYGVLGEFADPVYGKMKADFMLQFYAQKGFKFADSMVIANNIEESITKIELRLEYYKSFGDTKTPFQAEIFELKKPLNGDNLEEYYVDKVNVEEFVGSPSSRVSAGKKVYTAEDSSVPDSIKKLSSYIPSVVIPFNSTRQSYWARQIMDNRTQLDQQWFNNVFKGLYITTNYGDGTLLYVANTKLILHYKYIKNKKQRDTTATFISTKEIKQSNNLGYPQGQLEAIIDKVDTINHVRVPAGLMTEIILPISQLKGKLDRFGNPINWNNIVVNTVKFSLRSKTIDTNKYPIPIPSHLLMIKKEERKKFFINNQTPDNINSYVAAKDTSNVYNFNNIAKLIQREIRNAASSGNFADINMVVLPVTVNTTTASDGSTVITAVKNQLEPSAAMLIKTKDKTLKHSLQMEIIYSEY